MIINDTSAIMNVMVAFRLITLTLDDIKVCNVRIAKYIIWLDYYAVLRRN